MSSVCEYCGFSALISPYQYFGYGEPVVTIMKTEAGWMATIENIGDEQRYVDKECFDTREKVEALAKQWAEEQKLTFVPYRGAFFTVARVTVVEYPDARAYVPYKIGYEKGTNLTEEAFWEFEEALAIASDHAEKERGPLVRNYYVTEGRGPLPYPHICLSSILKRIA